MLTDFDVAGELAAVGTDRRDAWRFIRGYAQSWLSPIASGDGCTDAELDAAQRRLGLTLPVALREAYALLGRRPDLTSNQDHLLDPGHLHLDATGTVLVWRLEAQAVVRWGIRLADLDQPDPPVVLTRSMAFEAEQHWDPYLDRLSLTMVTVVLSESLFAAAAEGRNDNRDLTPPEPDRLADRFTRLPLPEYPGLTAGGPGTRWLAGPDLLLRDDEREWVWVLARTPTALEQLRGEFPGFWLMRPDG